MNKLVGSIVLGMAIGVHIPIAQAALVTTEGLVTNLRVEGPYGFIGIPSAPNSTCAYRVWVDMNSVLGRSVYATAMMAYAAGKTVIVRADDSGTRVYGVCPLYDIYAI